MTMVFDIFSKRKKFEYNLKERMILYLGFLGPILRCLRCKFFDYDHMIRKTKIFEEAKSRLDQDCDIIEIMDQVRKSKNFLRNFLSRQQKILLKFDHSNLIDGNSEEEKTGDESLDHDEVIAKNLSSPNGLVVIFTIAKLMKILKPYVGAEHLSSFDINLFQSFYSPVSLDEKPKANVMAAITEHLRKKIEDGTITNLELLQDASQDYIEPLEKMESTILQNADTDSLLNPNHNLRKSDKKETHDDFATIDPPMTHDLAPAKVYPDTELVSVNT